MTFDVQQLSPGAHHEQRDRAHLLHPHARPQPDGHCSVGSTEITSTTFDVPAGIELGASTIVVVTNGIPSAPRAITVAVNHPPIAVCRNVMASANGACQGTANATNVDNGSSDPDGDPDHLRSRSDGHVPLGDSSHAHLHGSQRRSGILHGRRDGRGQHAARADLPGQRQRHVHERERRMSRPSRPARRTIAARWRNHHLRPPSGSTFPLGTRLDTCTVSDGRGNSASCSFNVTVALGDNPVCCPAGTNIILGTSNNDTLNGTAGSDCILGRGAQDTINGNGGNDFISGGDGDDVITGGAGNDLIFGGSGQDNINGNTGNDVISGGDGDDEVFGGDGDDTLLGGQGQDRLFGENNNDTLVGETGDDRLEGGAGDDAWWAAACMTSASAAPGRTPSSPVRLRPSNGEARARAGLSSSARALIDP